MNASWAKRSGGLVAAALCLLLPPVAGAEEPATARYLGYRIQRSGVDVISIVGDNGPVYVGQGETKSLWLPAPSVFTSTVTWYSDCGREESPLPGGTNYVVVSRGPKREIHFKCYRAERPAPRKIVIMPNDPVVPLPPPTPPSPPPPPPPPPPPGAPDPNRPIILHTPNLWGPWTGNTGETHTITPIQGGFLWQAPGAPFAAGVRHVGPGLLLAEWVDLNGLRGSMVGRATEWASEVYPRRIEWQNGSVLVR